MSEIVPAPLFRLQEQATQIEVIYVQNPGKGTFDTPRFSSRGKEIERIGEGFGPCLHISFRHEGRRKTTLVPLELLIARGLPTDYESLVHLYPDLMWADR